MPAIVAHNGRISHPLRVEECVSRSRLRGKPQPIQFMMFHPLPTREGAPHPDAPFPG